MANYYMLGGDGKEYGPVSADQLRQWAVEGRANAQTQIRALGGAGYVSFGMVPELASNPALPAPIPTPQPVNTPQPSLFAQTQGAQDADGSAQTKRLASVIVAGNAWIKLLALAMFLLAFLLCCTLIGISIAWLPLWQGINLWGAANQAKQAVYTGSENDLAQALSRIRRSFTLGFFLILALAIFGLAYIAIALAMNSMGALSGLGGGLR